MVPLLFLMGLTGKKCPIFKLLTIVNFLGIIGGYVLCIIKRYSFPGKICSGDGSSTNPEL